MFRKVLVANRGEIAIRAFRATFELGCQTVAVFPSEDRNAEHRLQANEAYQIGERGHPVRAYLSVPEIIRAAQRTGADAVYPGYGFALHKGYATRSHKQALRDLGPSPIHRMSWAPIRAVLAGSA